MKTKKFDIKKVLLMFFVLAFLYLPILSIIVFSFNKANSLTRWEGFSFIWYKRLFQTEAIMDAVKVSVTIAILATIVSTIIGTFAAIAVARSKRKFRNVVLEVNNIPIVNPEIVTAIGMLLMLKMIRLSPGYFAMLIAHIAFSVPYVFITVYPKVRSLDSSLIEAATDLGATPFKALRHAIMPQIKVAVVAAAAIAFTMSFDDFVISYFTGGSESNISIYLYSLARGANPTINALSTIIIIVITLVVTLNYIRMNKTYKKAEVD